MGNFALFVFFAGLIAFVVWGVAMTAIGLVYDVYIILKYISKGIKWLFRRGKH